VRAHSRYRKMALAVYDRIADRPGRFDMAEVTAEIRLELTDAGADDELLDELAAGLAQSADDRRASLTVNDYQTDLFSGEPAVYDSIWRLGGGRRVRLRYANREDAVAHLALQAENVKQVVEAHKAEKRRLRLLLPFMKDPRTTIPEAVEKYRMGGGEAV